MAIKKNLAKLNRQGPFDQKIRSKKRGIFFEKEEVKREESIQHWRINRALSESKNKMVFE